MTALHKIWQIKDGWLGTHFVNHNSIRPLRKFVVGPGSLEEANKTYQYSDPAMIIVIPCNIDFLPGHWVILCLEDICA